MRKASDFRYNIGETKVPWTAVGENYNAADLMEIIKFMMQGEGAEYEQACEAVYEQIKKLDKILLFSVITFAPLCELILSNS